MTHNIIRPQPVYPIGEFLDGSWLCVSIEAGRPESWFPGHRDFALPQDEEYIELDDSDFIWDDDEAPTLRDEEVQRLGHRDLDWN